MNDSRDDFDDSFISAYLDGELAEAEREQVQAAINSSIALQKLVKDLSVVKTLVAASVEKSEPLTRSLQHGEWLVDGNKNIASQAEVTRGEPSSQVDDSRQKFRYSLGILASLAAVIAIVASLSSLNELGLVPGPQVAWEQSPPTTTAPNDLPLRSGLAAHANEDLQSAAPGSIASLAENSSSVGMAADNTIIAEDPDSAGRAFSKESDALPTGPSVAPKANLTKDLAKTGIPENAKSLLGYIEKRLNVAATVDQPKNWSFQLLNSNSAPENENPQLATTSPDKRIQIEIGPADDEVILHVAEDDLKDVLTRLNEKLEVTSEQNQQYELLAIAASTPRMVERAEIVAKSKDENSSSLPPPTTAEWSIKFASPAEVMQLADGTSNRVAGGGPSLRTRAMKSVRSDENRGESSDVAALASGLEASNFAQSEASFDEAGGPGANSRFTRGANNLEKLKRIRIKIKKEPTSSGSSE